MSEIKVLESGFEQLSINVDEDFDGDPLWGVRYLVTKPKAVIATHLDVLRAGSDIIRTNTYQASIDGFVKYLGLTEEESLETIRKAVDYAKEAVNIYTKEIENDENVTNRKPMIAGCCGSYGAFLHDGSEYTGSFHTRVSREYLMDWHRPRIRALLEKGVDLLTFDTIPCVREAEALIGLLREFPNARAWMSFSCRDDGKSVSDGSNFQEAVVRCYKIASPGQILAVGCNCLAPKYITSLIQGINKNKSGDFIPLVVNPTSGEKYTKSEGWKKEENSPTMHEFIDEWLDFGVRYIGGCCRTSIADLKRIRVKVDQRQAQGIHQFN